MLASYLMSYAEKHAAGLPDHWRHNAAEERASCGPDASPTALQFAVAWEDTAEYFAERLESAERFERERRLARAKKESADAAEYR